MEIDIDMELVNLRQTLRPNCRGINKMTHTYASDKSVYTETKYYTGRIQTKWYWLTSIADFTTDETIEQNLNLIRHWRWDENISRDALAIGYGPYVSTGARVSWWNPPLEILAGTTPLPRFLVEILWFLEIFSNFCLFFPKISIFLPKFHFQNSKGWRAFCPSLFSWPPLKCPAGTPPS